MTLQVSERNLEIIFLSWFSELYILLNKQQGADGKIIYNYRSRSFLKHTIINTQ